MSAARHLPLGKFHGLEAASVSHAECPSAGDICTREYAYDVRAQEMKRQGSSPRKKNSEQDGFMAFMLQRRTRRVSIHPQSGWLQKAPRREAWSLDIFEDQIPAIGSNFSMFCPLRILDRCCDAKAQPTFDQGCAIRTFKFKGPKARSITAWGNAPGLGWPNIDKGCKPAP